MWSTFYSILVRLSLIAGLLVPPLVLAQPETGYFLLIDEVEFLTDSDTAIPARSEDWQPLQLPLGSREGNADRSDRVIWMRFNLDKPTSTEIHSLYFYRYNLSLDVYFNGAPIGGSNYRKGRQTVGWNHPLLVDIQNANWREDGNEVMIRFVASYYGGTFAPLLFGARNDLLPLYEQRLFRQVKINEWLQALGIITTFFATILWYARKQDSTYLLFAGMTACWSMLTTHMVVYYILLDYRYWLPLLHVAIDLFALLMYCFLVRHIRIPGPKGEKAIKIWAIMAIVWHLFAPLQYWWMGAYGFHFVGNLFIFYLLARIVIKAIREQDTFAIAISLTVLVQLVLFGHDIIMVLFAEAEDWESAIYYSQFAFPLLLAVFAASLLHRFVSALNLSENLNRDLEEKVEASRQIIEQSYAERRQLELEQAAEQERLNIYRDLHDDVGSKLLSIVHAGRDSRLGELARAALESLRSAVSRANNPDQLLAEFLLEMREEAQLRLQGSGHAFTWQQPENLPEVVLTSEQVFHLNQIARELVSNIIRHAGATNVVMISQTLDHSLQICISDNGIGFHEDAINGNGLVHIKQRIAELQGHLHITNPEEGGLTVTFSIPLPLSKSPDLPATQPAS